MSMPSNTATMARTLSFVMGLTPLDRLQINDKTAISNCQFSKRMGETAAEQPFWFFQRIRQDGMLEVRTPTGYCDYIAIEDICDIIPGEPIIVQAMTTAAFIERNKPQHQRQAPSESDYAPAYLLYVHKDRWGRIDSAAVDFIDPQLNIGKTTFSPITQADRERLEKTINRTMLPIIDPTRNASLMSADKGIKKTTALNESIAKAFIQSALAKRHSVTSSLSDAALKDLSQRKINQIMGGKA